VIAWYLQHRYTVLFATLLATLVIAPLRGAMQLNALLLEAFVAGNLVVAATGISDRSAIRYALIAAATLAAVARFLPFAPSLAGLVIAADLLWVLIAALAAAAAVRFALRAPSVDREHVSAALSAYLLAGLVFAVLYLAVDNVWPGSLFDTAPGSTGLSLDSAIYFSYVTLATLGYGDVVPRTPVARGLAVVEALAAQLYLTVTVARLVGLHARDTAGRPPAA